MTLLQMSFSGAILILVIIILRTVAINRLPKKIFMALWGIAVLRLLLPFSIPSIFSIYSLVGRNTAVYDTIVDTPAVSFIPENVDAQVLQNNVSVSVPFIIWCIGAILCGAFFIVTYMRCRFEFQASFPVENGFAAVWLEEHPLKRPIEIRQSGRIPAPLTYGIFHPVILMPKKTDWENEQRLQYILLHEYVHICHFDAVIKIILAIALCIHWFNPMVWAMYILCNRDIELVCDEGVVRKLGQDSRSTYARTLISMEEKNSLTPLCNNFSRNAIEGRVTAIMKTKKVTPTIIIIGVVLLVAVGIVFATSMKKDEVAKEEKHIENFDVPEVVLAQAQECVLQSYNNIKGGAWDYSYSDWRIENLEYRYTYDDFDGKVLEVYNLNYEFLSDSPESVILVGGMGISDDGWVVPGYPNSEYLIFERDGGELNYLTAVMENDCWPGDEAFTGDLKIHFDNIRKEAELQELIEKQTILARIEELDGKVLTFDMVEWVESPSERATELGIAEDDAPSGFYVYNETATMESYVLADDCRFEILDWSDNFKPKRVSLEEFEDILKDRETPAIPYHLTINNNEIVRIAEQYVP